MVNEGVVGFDANLDLKDFTKPIRRIQFKNPGDSYRIAFLSDSVVFRKRHYLKGLGYRRCLAHTGFCPACVCDIPKLKDAQPSFGANVFVFDTIKAEGDDTAKRPGQISGSIYCYIFGADKFISLKAIKQMNKSLVGLDIRITCTEIAFQKMLIQNYPRDNSLINEPGVLDMANKALLSDGYPIEKIICKDVDGRTMISDFKLNKSTNKESTNNGPGMEREGATTGSGSTEIVLPKAEISRPKAEQTVIPQIHQPQVPTQSREEHSVKNLTEIDDIMNQL